MSRAARTLLAIGLAAFALAATERTHATSVQRSNASSAPRQTLDIYFVDVEGGQATLIVTPAGQSILVDAGFAGAGGFDGVPGDPKKARDANRVLAAAREAGLTAIDYLISTHFHADHDGGIPELSQLLPIRAFVDHDRPLPSVESVAGSLAAFDRYAAARAKSRHMVATPGETLPIEGAALTFVASGGAAIDKPLAGADGGANASCRSTAMEAQEKNENPRSTGFVLQFGRFRFLDLGDLSGPPLFALACPRNLVGPVDAYLVAHHGGADTADPATFAAFRPRVAILNNGAVKGGAPEMLAVLHQAPNVDVWQLHRSENPGAQNFPDDRIANLDAATAHWLKLRANQDGSFELTNARTGASKKYAAAS
jgi:beta-lactamase superfamily II metal-dependent hydrolase